LALQTAQEAIVLLKNEGVLPLDRTQLRSIAVIGPNAYPAPYAGGGSAKLAPWYATSLLEGLSHEAPELQIEYARGIADLGHLAVATLFTTEPGGGRPGLEVEVFASLDFSGSMTTRVDPNINQGVPPDLTALVSGDRPLDPNMFTPVRDISSRWTGYYTPGEEGAYDVFVQVDSIAPTTGYRLYLDDTLVADHWTRSTALLQTVRVSMDVRPHKVVLEYRGNVGGLLGSVPFVRLGIVRISDWVDATAKQFAARADAAIVAVGFDSTTEAEGSDRSFQLPAGQDELIRQICAMQKRCIVIATSGGAFDMNGWLDEVPGLVQSWYLGQEGGTALARMLLGTVNPSGRLPATFESRWEDNPAYTNYYPKPGTNSVPYAEGIFVGYRGFEAFGTKPQFPFGYGLSYTTFEYQDLRLLPRHHPSEVLYDASFWVTNSGTRTGALVAQLYIAPPAGSQRPPKELKGFAKITLQPGESRKITLPLNARAFSRYDTASGWRADAGAYEVLVGDSTDQISLQKEVTLPRAISEDR
jgi:beta-glucosidase